MFFDSVIINLKISLFYCKSFVISVSLNVVIFIFNIIIFKSIYSYNQSQTIVGYSFSQMVWYIGSTFFISRLIYCNPENSISEGIISGELALRLLKPIGLLKWEYAKAISSKPVVFTTEFLPTFVIFIYIIPPDFLSIIVFIKFIIISALSFHLFFLINFFIGTLAFDFKSARAFTDIKNILIVLLGGAFLPIDFFPKTVQKIIFYLPFKFFYYVPSNFFINKEGYQGISVFIETIVIMLIWIVLILLLCTFLWKLMLKRFCSAGG